MEDAVLAIEQDDQIAEIIAQTKGICIICIRKQARVINARLGVTDYNPITFDAACQGTGETITAAPDIIAQDGRLLCTGQPQPVPVSPAVVLPVATVCACVTLACLGDFVNSLSNEGIVVVFNLTCKRFRRIW